MKKYSLTLVSMVLSCAAFSIYADPLIKVTNYLHDSSTTSTPNQQVATETPILVKAYSNLSCTGTPVDIQGNGLIKYGQSATVQSQVSGVFVEAVTFTPQAAASGQSYYGTAASACTATNGGNASIQVGQATAPTYNPTNPAVVNTPGTILIQSMPMMSAQ